MAFFAAFFVSLAFTVVGELLRPKQKPNDPKPASIDDFDLPTVSETRNWPWFAGTCKIEGPNLTWYGDLRTEAIKKKVKTGWFSSTRVTVNTKYYLGMEMFLGIGGDTGIDDVLEVRFNDEMPKAGKYTKSTTADSIVFNFNDPDFFGGNEEGGGVVGTIRIAKGTQTQNANSYLQTVLGRLRSAYRGLSFAVFEGFYFGTRTSIPAVGFIVQRFPNSLGMTGGKHRIGDDANAVCMIYELATDLKWGGQMKSARVNTANWIAIGEKLHAEGLGLSMLINSARTAEDQIKEILRHIDGVMYHDPTTNQMHLAIARDDYDVATLPLYNQSSISSFTFSRGSWSETKNTLMLSFVDRAENYTVRTIPLRDTANIYGRGGVVEADQLDLLGFSNATAASKRGSVALKTLSYPLLTGKVVVNSREARSLRPGSVIKVDWPPENIVGLVLRITRIDYGSPMANRVEMDCVEDIFSLTNASYIVPPTSNWQNPVGAPQPLVAQYAFEAPYHLIGEQARYIATVGSRFSSIDQGYDTWQDAAGGASYINTGRVTEFTPTGVLAADYPSSTDSIDGIGFVVASPREFGTLQNATQGEFESGESLALIKSAAGEEIVAWKTVVDNGNGTYTIKNVMRGVFDTLPLTHVAGARVWILSYGMGLLADAPYAADGTVTGKLLPYNVRGVVALSAATQLSVALSSRAWKPYPAGKLFINGDATDISISGNAVVTWGIRHRVLQSEGNAVVAQDAASYTTTPEGGYTVRVYIDGALKRTVAIEAAPFDTFTYTPAMRIEDNADAAKLAQITVQAVNGAYSSAIRQTQSFFMLDALDPLVVTTETLPDGQPGFMYSEQLVATGGATPYAWTVVAGALPSGLTLSSTGLISGTPIADEEQTFTVQVEGAEGSTDTQALTLQINTQCANYVIPAATGEVYNVTEAEDALPATGNELHICNEIT